MLKVVHKNPKGFSSSCWMENEWHPRRRKLPVILLQQVRESTPVSWNPINCVIDGWQLPEQLASILNDVIWISVGTP